MASVMKKSCSQDVLTALQISWMKSLLWIPVPRTGRKRLRRVRLLKCFMTGSGKVQHITVYDQITPLPLCVYDQCTIPVFPAKSFARTDSICCRTGQIHHMFSNPDKSFKNNDNNSFITVDTAPWSGVLCGDLPDGACL